MSMHTFGQRSPLQLPLGSASCALCRAQHAPSPASKEGVPQDLTPAPRNPSYNNTATGGILALNCWMLHYFLLKTVSFWIQYWVINTARWKPSSYLKVRGWQCCVRRDGRLRLRLDVKTGYSHKMRQGKNLKYSVFQMMLKTPPVSPW